MSGHLCAAGRCAASYGAYGPALVLFRIAGTLLDEAAAVLGPKLEDTAQASSAAQCLSELLIILGPCNSSAVLNHGLLLLCTVEFVG